MTALAVFLHTVMLLLLGPVLAGLIGHARGGSALSPAAQLTVGLKEPGRLDLRLLSALAAGVVAGLLIPLFAPEAVLGFLGDGFVALILLVGASVWFLPVPATSVLACAVGVWSIGALTGSTDLGQALSDWQPGLGAWLLFLGMVLGIAPILRADPNAGPGINGALTLWARSTLQLGWLALGIMAFPWGIPLTGWGSLAGAIAVFLLKLLALGWVLAFIGTRWPRFPLSSIGLVVSILALGLVKLAG